MSALESSEQLVELIRLSELIDEHQLQRSLREFESKGAARSAEALAAFLIDCGLLTKWQASKLQEGKYRGFFMGPYVLIDFRESTAKFTRYLIRHNATGRLLVMKVFPLRSSEITEDNFEIEDL